MTPFIHDDFILHSETAKKLFHEHAENMPIFDFHNHLNPREIYEDNCYDNIADVWLGGDHYKWRAMRANGVSEKLITGDGDPYEKFLAYADTIQNSIGNPLYHWTHMELKRYFGIDKTLTPATAKEIWDECNEKLKQPEFSVRNLLRMQKVTALCTTDDPIDSLEWHKKLKEDGFEIQVLPTFRPEKALGIDKPGFADYVKALADCVGKEINNVEDMLAALFERLQYFIGVGCRVTDHSLESAFYAPTTLDEVNAIFAKKMGGTDLTEEEAAKFRGYALGCLGKEYAKNGLVMQIHIGAIRNNSSRLFEKLGPDVGVDSQADFSYAPQLSALLNSMDKENLLPKTVLYYLNPKDSAMLATMAGNFQSNEDGIRGKVQHGTAWWFCDHKNGMEYQMDTLCDVGLISTFIGMLTDSRSFLSFPRHEYFRRILCNKIGKLVEDGEYPADMEYLGKMIEDICYNNAVKYFNL